MRKAVKLTVDEFLEEYRDVNDGNLHELQDGEVIVSPPPGSDHGELHSIVNWLLQIYCEDHAGIRVFDASAVEFSEDTLRGPDISVILPGDKVHFTKGRMVGAPSLIVEIVSPSKPPLDLVVKRGLFTSKGVSEIWYLDPDTEEALFLHKTRGGNYAESRLETGIYESKVLKGLSIDVAALFALDKRRLRKALAR